MSKPAPAPATGLLAGVDALLRVQQALSEGVVLAMALMVTAEVFCRGLLGFSLLIVEEVGGYLLVALVFLGMGVALRDGALFRVEFLIGNLPPRSRALLQWAFDLACLAFVLMLCWQFAVLVVDTWQRGSRAATTLGTPLFVPQIVMLVGAVSLALVLIVQLLEGLDRIRGGRHE